jgi:hypothetical protein
VLEAALLPAVVVFHPVTLLVIRSAVALHTHPLRYDGADAICDYCAVRLTGNDLTAASSIVAALAIVGGYLSVRSANRNAIKIAREERDARHEERLWDRRADLYVDLIQAIDREHISDVNDLWMTADTLTSNPAAYWQSSRDQNPQAWVERTVRVSAYASDQVLALYSGWDHALLSLAGVVQPSRVTGAPRPADLMAVLREGAERVNLSGSSLRGQIRSELQSTPAYRG